MAKAKPIAQATPETELAGLVVTRTNLQSRQLALTAEVEQAVATRRTLLIEGGNAAAIAEAERTCREIEGTIFGVADALAEVERRITATEERIDQDRILSERENTAATLERDSQAIDAAAECVRQAVGALVAANAALAAAITPTAAPLFAKHDMHGMRDGEPPERVAAYLTGHMIATALPQIEVSEAGRQEHFGWTSAKPIEPADGETPARPLLTDPLRGLAARVRSGDASPVLRRNDPPEPDFTPSVSEVQIYVIEPFVYRSRAVDAPTPITSLIVSVPGPVADRAVALGVAARAEPKNFESIRARRPHAVTGVSIFDLRDIGFVLEDWRAAEAKRAREAWLAEQGREAA